MQIKCSHVRTLYSKPDVDFRIAVYRPFPFQEVEEEFVAKGNGIPLSSCVDIFFEGKFVEDNRGTALVVSSYSSKVKRTRGNVLGYLSSGAIKGIGYGLAKNIVDTFGLDAVDILEQNPERLQEVKGIGENNLQMIMESFAENREIQSLMEYLGQFDISVNKAQRIAKHFGAHALEVVQSDIFSLCEVEGFGFVTVDEIARKMHHPMNTLPRVKAAAVYTLQENRSQGHLYMEPNRFLEELKKLLNRDGSPYQFADADLKPLANEALESDRFAYKNKSVYLDQDYRNEKDFAVTMARRLAYDRSRLDKVVELPPLPETDIALSEEQETAVMTALRHNTCIITGRPGTGKTTVLKTFLQAHVRQTGRRDSFLLCAPTGRAARRLSEATGCSAFTVHKAFGLLSEDEEQFQGEERTKGGVVVIDEVSMMDMWLASQVIARLDPSTKLILVGDPDQLPSVGPGNVLHELIRFGGIPTVHLRQIFRQAEGSAIAENAQRIAEKNPELLYDRDSFIFVPASSQKQAKDLICTLYKRASDKVGAENVQILTPMRKRGECSANTLNTAIQQMVQKCPEAGTKHFDRFFCEGDPVIQIRNVEGINNGDMGIVCETNPPNVKVSYSTLDMEQDYSGETLNLLDLAYALTVHKSQGSEYPIVIIPVMREHSFMLTRNLLYTGITRGKKRVVLIGDEAAVRKAVLTEDTTKRRTHLANRLAVEIRQRIAATVETEKGDSTCETEDLQSA